MRNRHTLGEPTYAALLEMTLLEDEREVPWPEQARMVGVMNAASSRCGQHRISGGVWADTTLPRGISPEDKELTVGVWWTCGSHDTRDGVESGHVLDDAQLVRNVLPLTLILQYLPTMAESVQVRACRALKNICGVDICDVIPCFSTVKARRCVCSLAFFREYSSSPT